MTSTTITAPAGGPPMAAKATDAPVLDRATGELVDVREASTDRLGRFLEDTAELVGQLGEARSAVEREVLRRMDTRASWTTAGQEFQLQAPSPEAGMSYYDADALLEVLIDLGRRGLITRQAAHAALKTDTTVEHKAQQAGVKALLSLGGEVADAVAACRRRREQPPRRSVKVRRKRRT